MRSVAYKTVGFAGQHWRWFVLGMVAVWLLMSKDDNFGCDNPGKAP